MFINKTLRTTQYAASDAKISVFFIWVEAIIYFYCIICMGVSITRNHDRNSTRRFTDIQKISSGYFLNVSKYMGINA